MKKITSILICCIVYTLAATSTIQMEDGTIYEGTIMAEDENQIILWDTEGREILIDKSLVRETDIEDESFIGSFGIGFGMPYGGLGTNIDLYAGNHVGFTLGFGTYFFTYGWSIGGRLYLVSPQHSFRPRISAIFGTNGIIAIEQRFGTYDVETFSGLSYGAGTRIHAGKTGRHAIDIDVFYIGTSGFFDRVEELKDDPKIQLKDVSDSRVKISFGYRYVF